MTDIVEVLDERHPLALDAIALMQEAIGDVHPASFLLTELQQTRLQRVPEGGYHLLALPDPTGGDTPLGAAAGVYLGTVGAGFVSYLAVRDDQRGRGVGRRLREALVQTLEAQAQAAGEARLGRVVGEIQRDSPWLRMLVKEGRAVPLHLPYFHPWMSRRGEGVYSLYLEPLADTRRALPREEAAALVDAVWRRAYRIAEPVRWDTYRHMMQQIQMRSTIGADPELMAVLTS